MSTTAHGALRPVASHAVAASGSVTTGIGTAVVRIEATTAGTITFATGAAVHVGTAQPEYFRVSGSGETLTTATFVGSIVEMGA